MWIYEQERNNTTTSSSATSSSLTSFSMSASSRPFLWRIVTRLDLNSSPVFRAQCLALSEPISEGDAAKLEKLVGATQSLKLAGTPRRLALAKALLLTATPEEKRDHFQRVRKMLVAADDKDDAFTQGFYERAIAPLVMLIGDPLAVWVQQRRASGKLIGAAFEVTPAKNHVSALKDMIKLKLGSDYTGNPALISIFAPGSKDAAAPDAAVSQTDAKRPCYYEIQKNIGR